MENWDNDEETMLEVFTKKVLEIKLEQDEAKWSSTHRHPNPKPLNSLPAASRPRRLRCVPP